MKEQEDRYAAPMGTDEKSTLWRKLPPLDPSERIGAIGPVPVVSFAYTVGAVPRFDADGKRIE
jgi:hypothetical protein